MLRPYQMKLKQDVLNAWAAGSQNVLMRLDTGGGKTAILSEIVKEHPGHSRVIAHRQELVGQLSVTLARNGVRHNIMASDSVRRSIAKLHVAAIGYSLIDPNSHCMVISVDTMVRRVDPQAALVTLWVVDEGHHVVKGNKWHKVISTYVHPACKGLLPTATPLRADGQGLGRHADGVADIMVEGPPMRWLIEQGYLCDYRIFCPASDLVVLKSVAANGDWSPAALKEASQQSHIVSDAVKEYKRFAAGLLCIVFTTDVQTATDMAEAFNAAGISAECLTGQTDDFARSGINARFERRETLVIVAVDIVSEGYDIPALEAIIFARPTASYAVYSQQFGRSLRMLLGKLRAIVIDLVGNVLRHGGPPDRERIWSLDAKDKRAKAPDDAIPLKVCTACFEPFEAIHRACPHCGHIDPPAARNGPKAVDGDIAELDADTLAMLRAAVDAVDMPLAERTRQWEATGLSGIPLLANVKRHRERQAAQAALRTAMSVWGGTVKAQGFTDSQMQRIFYFKFGISVIEAVALAKRDAETLTERLDLSAPQMA